MKSRILIRHDPDIVVGVKRPSPLSILICAVSVALLAFYLALWLSFARSIPAKRSDFVIYYTAGSLPFSKLYNIEAQREVETKVTGSPFPVAGEVLPFNHTPVFVPLLHLLVNDNYASSYLRWTALLWVAAFLCVFLIFKMTGDAPLAFAAGSFYPLFTYIQQGHDTVFLLLGLLLGAHLLSLRKDLLAGFVLSLATLKPHFAIFLAIPLIARPKAFLGFFAGSTLLAVYSIVLIGTKGASDYLGILTVSATGEMFGVRPLMMANLLGLMERSGVNPSTARPIAWVVFFLTAAGLLVVWKRNSSRPPFALTVLLAVFTSPHLYGHDIALLLGSFATVSKSNALLLLVSSMALISSNIIPNNLQFVVMYIFMTAVLIMSITDVRRLATASS